jgi:hypothetical protein
VTEFNSTVVFLTDFCVVLLLFLLGVSEITSELSVFSSTTIEAPPFRFDATSEGLTFPTGEFSSLPVENDSPVKILCRQGQYNESKGSQQWLWLCGCVYAMSIGALKGIMAATGSNNNIFGSLFL